MAQKKNNLGLAVRLLTARERAVFEAGAEVPQASGVMAIKFGISAAGIRMRRMRARRRLAAAGFPLPVKAGI